MAEKKHVKICPQCGSTRITIPPAGMDIKMALQDYCKDCKNRGIFPEVEGSKAEGFRKKLRKR